MRSAFDPEGKHLPIKLDSTSNGEFVPVPLDAANRRANRLAQRWASDNARRRGVVVPGRATGRTSGSSLPSRYTPPRQGGWVPSS